MASEFIRAFIMIFMAEMGDKSQILAMTFSTKYKVKKVFIGLFIGILLNHMLAVFIGSQLNQYFPIEMITLLAGILFVIFGLYSFRLDTNEAEELKETKYGPIITIALLFFIGELGDKTQLTAITLSSEAQYPLVILTATVLGMLFTSMFGIFLGIKFGRKIPVKYMKLGSSLVFLIFGILKISSNTMNLDTMLIQSIIVLVLVIYALLLIFYIKNYSRKESLYIRTAIELKRTYQLLSIKLESICLGSSHCGVCSGNRCLIGYTKNVIKDLLNDKEVNLEYIENKTIKDFDETKVREALAIVMEVLNKDTQNPKYNDLHKVRKIFQQILVGYDKE